MNDLMKMLEKEKADIAEAFALLNKEFQNLNGQKVAIEQKMSALQVEANRLDGANTCIQRLIDAETAKITPPADTHVEPEATTAAPAASE